MAEIISVYSDAGVISKTNSSKVGVTWAFAHVDANDDLRHFECGVLRPEQLGLEELNSDLAETYAAIRSLWPMPDGWNGVFYCDNQNAIGRIFWNWACNGIPEFMVQQTRELRGRLKVRNPVLLGGHPSRADLERGTRKRDGKPVSKWNVLCDEECKRLSKSFETMRTGKFHK